MNIEDIKTIFDKYENVEDLKSKGIEELSETFTGKINGLVTKKDELLGTNRKLKDRVEEVTSEFDTFKNKFKGIDDPEFAITAIQKVKDNNLSKNPDFDKSLEEEVSRKMKSLYEERDTERRTYTEQIEALKKEKEEQVAKNRTQKFENEANRIANKVGVNSFSLDQGHFQYSLANVFKWDDDENDFVARDSNGDRIYRPTDPLKPVDMESYSKEILAKQAPHLFISNSNPSLNGNTSKQLDVSRYVKENGRPTIEGLAYRSEHGEEAFNKLVAKQKAAKKAA